ncbi:acyl-CoA N-acyltransferase [Amylocarpus encephaloides]|uniref:Acyl-CoA N-acyltransferase n=1 Tax=Amylocarpus encephaloides TaxID=45428 RepID=A0A9P8C4I2_9HELO|nr:acyl-CoA N-acyltransferase [Amylocarpus encephaloides]
MSYPIETPRLWLQPMTVEEHLDDFWELWTDPKALMWTSQGIQESKEAALELMLKVLPNEENPNIDKFALLLRPVAENPMPYTNAQGKPKMVGMVGTNRMSDHGLETGYCMNIKYWGRGYAGEAFAAFLKYYWTLPNRTEFSLVAKVDLDNIPSQKILTRVGAKRGEILKDFYARFIDGGKKRDIECWYLERPGTVASEKETGAVFEVSEIP